MSYPKCKCDWCKTTRKIQREWNTSHIYKPKTNLQKRMIEVISKIEIRTEKKRKKISL